MGTSATVFAAVYAAMPDARATLLAGRETVAQCLCTGVPLAHASSEQGVYASADVSVRYLFADDPNGGQCERGRLVKLTLGASGEEFTLRIVGRSIVGEIVHLTLAGEEQ
jgi:hypothetical protein